MPVHNPPRYGLLRRLRNAWMAALTDAASDVGTSDVGNGRQIAKVRFSDWQPAWAVMARDVPPSSRPALDRSRLRLRSPSGIAGAVSEQRR
jgi:hypothetical protein